MKLKGGMVSMDETYPSWMKPRFDTEQNQALPELRWEALM